jgi:LuxR family maltose regulon positive regulatory protein
MLGWIARHNLFLSALDDSGLWFRYHPLMRDALLHRLRHGGELIFASCTIAPAAGLPRSSCGPRRYAMRWPPKSAAKDAEAGAQSLAEEEILILWCSGSATCLQI